MVESHVELYTDGSCDRNPGAGGFSYIVKYFDTPEGSDLPQKQEIEFAQGYRLTTNNRMEIMGAIFGIQKVIELCQKDPGWKNVTQVLLRSDSEYFCNAINRKWLEKWAQNNWMTSGFRGMQPKPIKSRDLWEQVITCQDQLRSMNVNLVIEWVKGHAGNEYNERCDKLAVGATKDSNTHLIDMEYEKTAPNFNRR